MEIDKILFKYGGEDWIYNWRYYFSSIIKLHMYDLPEEYHAPVWLEDGYCYLKDTKGDVIWESGISIEDLNLMGDCMTEVMYGYLHTPLEKRPWVKIGHEIFMKFRDCKARQIEEAAIERDRISEKVERERRAQISDERVKAGEVYVIKSGNEWVELGLAAEERKNLWLNLWREGEICFMFGDSNLGKTIYALQIAFHVAEDQKVVYFDFEMDYKDFQSRYASRGGQYKIPSGFMRCEPDRDIFLAPDAENIFIREMEKVVERERVKVIVIDNLTYISRNSQSSTGASVLMYRLKLLQKKYGLSILILAHTSKRNMHLPLTQNDLAGSKKLFNFTDSVFAIGQSVRDSNLQYIKQLKSRGGKINYGSDNVLLIERSYSGNRLYFESVGCDSEINHLKEGKAQEHKRLKKEIVRLREDGLSQREIGRCLKISVGKVNMLIRDME